VWGCCASTSTRHEETRKWLTSVGIQLHKELYGSNAGSSSPPKADGSSLPVHVSSYDWSRSTQQNHQALGGASMHTQQFGHIRAALDAGYHGHYSLERQAVQDRLIAGVLKGIASQVAPWVIFTAGAMGVGKSRTMKWLHDSQILPLDAIVHVDPDEFKVSLPEWDEYCRRDPMTAGFHTRQESGLCCEIAQEAALQERKHIWVDGSLRDLGWYRHVFESIARRYPEYQIAIIHVVADEQIVFDRAKERAEATGRHVPEQEIRDSLKRVPAAVEGLTPLARIVAVIDNGSAAGEPKLVQWRDHGQIAHSVTRRRHKGWYRMRDTFTDGEPLTTLQYTSTLLPQLIIWGRRAQSARQHVSGQRAARNDGGASGRSTSRNMHENPRWRWQHSLLGITSLARAISSSTPQAAIANGQAQLSGPMVISAGDEHHTSVELGWPFATPTPTPTPTALDC